MYAAGLRLARLARLLVIAIAFCISFPTLSLAQAMGNQRYSVHIDAGSGNTGCTATVQDAFGSQTLSGLDYQVHIDTTQDATGATVNAVSLATCNAGTWGSPTPVETGARTLASTVVGGKTIEHIEAAVPMALLNAKPSQYLTLNTSASGGYLLSPVSGPGPGSIGLAVPATRAHSVTAVPFVNTAVLAALMAIIAMAGWWGIRTGRVKSTVIAAVCTTIVASSVLVVGVVSAAGALNTLNIKSMADWSGIAPLATDPQGDNIADTSDCRIPDDYIDKNRYPLFMARQVLRELVQSLQSTGSLSCT